MLLMIVISAAIILIPQINLIKLMLLAQFINGLILPVLLIIILKLVNNKKLMGEYSNNVWLNLITWIGTILIISASLAMLVVTVMGT